MSSAFTSPLIIFNKNGKNKAGAIDKVIDGDAVLSNLNVDELTDEQRRNMLTNILSAIQTPKSDLTESIVPKTTKTKHTKAAISSQLGLNQGSDVRILSSLDELNKHNDKDQISESGGKPDKQPIYVVLLPQNKKK